MFSPFKKVVILSLYCDTRDSAKISRENYKPDWIDVAVSFILNFHLVLPKKFRLNLSGTLLVGRKDAMGKPHEPSFAYSFLHTLQITFVISKFRCSLSNKEVPVPKKFQYIYTYILHINYNVDM